MPRPFFGLIHRRECLLPTFRGWLAIFILVAFFAVSFVRGIFGFLAVQDSLAGGVLVAEGWAPEHALVETLAEYRRHPYAGIFVTGVPMERGAVLSEYQTFAELSAASLVRLGADPRAVHAVPSPEVRQDRTYATAVALRDYLREHRISAAKVNVVSLGAHSRRTRLLFQQAFGSGTRVGIIAVPHRDFDPARWWRSSQGFRVVTGEVIAYGYVRCFFHPERE